MPIRNLRAVIREKDLDLAQIARQIGIQKSNLELIMSGVYCPDLDLRIKICEAISEPFSNEIFETGSIAHKAPLG